MVTQAEAKALSERGVVVDMKALTGDDTDRPRMDVDDLLYNHTDTFNLMLWALTELQQDKGLLGYYQLAGMGRSSHICSVQNRHQSDSRYRYSRMASNDLGPCFPEGDGRMGRRRQEVRRRERRLLRSLCHGLSHVASTVSSSIRGTPEVFVTTFHACSRRMMLIDTL